MRKSFFDQAFVAAYLNFPDLDHPCAATDKSLPTFPVASVCKPVLPEIFSPGAITSYQDDTQTTCRLVIQPPVSKPTQ